MNPFHKRLIKALVFLFSLGLCLSATSTILDLWHRRDLLSSRKQELGRLNTENADLEQKLRDAQSPDYVERMARDKLGLVKDGETVVLLNEQSKTEREQDAKLPNWQRWYNLFF